MKRLIVDLDNTLTLGADDGYRSAPPNLAVIAKIRHYKESGFDIAIHSSRNMRTYNGSVGLITANTVPIVLEWLKEHNVPFDEIWIGKPWCGEEGFYIDDRAVRPAEFVRLSYNEIIGLIERDKMSP